MIAIPQVPMSVIRRFRARVAASRASAGSVLLWSWNADDNELADWEDHDPGWEVNTVEPIYGDADLVPDSGAFVYLTETFADAAPASGITALSFRFRLSEVGDAGYVGIAELDSASGDGAMVSCTVETRVDDTPAVYLKIYSPDTISTYEGERIPIAFDTTYVLTLVYDTSGDQPVGRLFIYDEEADSITDESEATPGELWFPSVAYIDAMSARPSHWQTFAVYDGSPELPEAPALPPVPTDLVAEAVSSTAITLTWESGGAGATDFAIEQSLDGVDWEVDQTVAFSITEVSYPSLEPETEYFFRVRAYNAAGYSAYSNVASATTEAEADPGALPWTWDGEDGLEAWTSTYGDGLSIVSFDGGLGLRVDGTTENAGSVTRDHTIPESGTWSVRFRLAIEAEAEEDSSLLSATTLGDYDTVLELNAVPAGAGYVPVAFGHDVSYTEYPGDDLALTVGQVYTVEVVHDLNPTNPTLTVYINGVEVSSAVDLTVAPAAEGFGVGSLTFGVNQGQLIYKVGSVSVANDYQGYEAPVPGALLTEGGDTLTTEDGDTLTQE